MIARNCEGRAPTPGALSAADEALLADAWALADKARAAMGEFALHAVLAEIWKVVADANRYFASEEPWKQAKSDPARMATVLWTTAETLRNVALLAQPFIPAAAGKFLDLLAVDADHRQFAHVGAGHKLVGGVALPPPAPIFPRYVEPEEAPAAKGAPKGKAKA